MIKKLFKCAWGIVNTVLLALYLFVLYELLLVPAVLDWSSFGVLLALVLIGLLIWCLPAEKRVSTTVLGITFLLAMKAMDNIKDYPFLKHVFGTIVIFFILLAVGKLLGRFTLRRYVVVFLVAVVLNMALNLTEVPFLTEFRVKWESPLLYKKLASVDYFPTRLADVDGDKVDEIITQENLAEAQREQRNITENGKKYEVLQPESNHFAVYKWDGRTFREIPPGRYSPERLAAVLPVDYPGYPFYKTSMHLSGNREIEEEMAPLVDRARLSQETTRFGSFPFEILAMDQKSLDARLNSLNTLGWPANSTAMAVGDLIPGPPAETVSTVEGPLTVRENNHNHNVVGTIDQNLVPDIGTSEILVGDVNGDKTDELLLTAEQARILKLLPGGRWQVLWTSPGQPNAKARFQGFRFDDIGPLGSDSTPQIIALSKSNVRANPTRYMTGYVYKDGALRQKWRVFSGLINLQVGDVDGDRQNELVGYMYRQQRVYVLKKHNIPVVPVLYGITGALIAAGFALQLVQRKQRLNGGVENA